uniref:Ubiquitin carboxyl-terminal hydrolase 47 C-terminal domain-containing protein n=1 Tax=Amphimedon queenslandica TaxID=400682 RepID=A0A1X7UGA8_AMPQE
MQVTTPCIIIVFFIIEHHVLINIFNNRHTFLSQSLCDSVGIAWLLYAECMLTQEAVSRVVSASPSIPNQREALLTVVKEAVQTNTNSLHTFANVLCTISTNVSLGQAILDDISKYFPTPKVGMVSETLKDAIVSQNTSTDETKIPKIAQSVEVHVPVPKDLLMSFTSVRMSYGRMFYNIGKIIKRKSPPLDEIKEFLSCCSSILRRKVEQCTDLSGILHLIQNECSLTNIELLHSVVDEMEVAEATKYIETYRTELKEFCKSLSISLCLKERFDSIPHLLCETVTFIFDWEPEEHVLKDIKDILSKVSGKLLIIKYIETSTSISVTCSFPFSDVGFTVLRMIENIHILMGQGLKKLTIGNLTLWKRQDVRQKELKQKDQDSLQHMEVISYILLEEAEYRLKDAISSKEKETIDLTQEISMAQVFEVESLSIQSDTESVKEVEEEPLYEELTVLSSQFNEILKENKKLSNKLSKMKVEYLRSLSSNTGSAASKVRRGMAFEADNCKFHLEAMTRPDYQPLVDNKRIIEKLQERITLMNMELITERECNEKIMKDIKDLKETEGEEIEYDSLSDDEVEYQMCAFKVHCKHPVTGKLKKSTLKVHEDELLPTVLDKAYELMKLSPHIPIERCRLVNYDFENDVMFDLDESQHLTIGEIAGGDGAYYYFRLFLETCKETETFKKYSCGGINLKISMVDLSTGEVEPAKPVRGEWGWTVGELKQFIGELFNINLSCLRLLIEEYHSGYMHVRDITDVEGCLEKMLYQGYPFTFSKQVRKFNMYVSSDPEDYRKEFHNSLMYRYIQNHIYCILLNITIPPEPEATPTTIRNDTIVSEAEKRMMIKIISITDEKKGKERKIQVQVDKRITLAQLKEELVPLIGVPATGFKLYRISGYQEYEMERWDKTLMGTKSGSELITRLGRALERGEYRIKLYLLQVNNIEFCNYLMKFVVAKNTPVRKIKKQIIEELKIQGIDCDLELDKMRLRKKIGMSPGTVYLDQRVIHASREIYVEQLKEERNKNYGEQRQVYVMRWRPSQCSVDPIKEMILDANYYYYSSKFIFKLSEFSGIPVEYVSYSQVLISFPVEISCLDIENKFKWHSITSESYSLGLYDDGCVIYYKDNRETMKELTDRERSEIQEAEEARSVGKN